MAAVKVFFVVVAILVHQNAANDVTTALPEENLNTIILDQFQSEIDHLKLLELGMSSMNTKLDSLKNSRSETNQQLEQQETKIDSLMDQTSALTNQLTQFFAIHSQNQSDSDVDSTGGHLSDNGAPSMTLQMEATGGVAYVRWGRTKCRGDATYLYKGYAASGKIQYVNTYTYTTGGGSELICLHNTPEFENIVAGNLGYSPLVGVEYGFAGSPFSTVNNYDQPLTYNDMPCTVCHVQTRSFQVMIPGRKTCPSGWTLEYWGYLVSTHHTHYKSSFNCVDEAPETVPGGLAAGAFHYVYTVETSCVAIYCPPYRTENEITCVVCSK